MVDLAISRKRSRNDESGPSRSRSSSTRCPVRLQQLRFIVLGAIIEHVTRHRYDDWVARQVLRPAGMASTAIRTYKPADAPQMADGYVMVGWDGEPLQPGARILNNPDRYVTTVICRRSRIHRVARSRPSVTATGSATRSSTAYGSSDITAARPATRGSWRSTRTRVRWSSFVPIRARSSGPRSGERRTSCVALRKVRVHHEQGRLAGTGSLQVRRSGGGGAPRSGRGRATGNEQASARDLRHHDDSMDRFRRHQGIPVTSPSPTYYLVVVFFVARRGVTGGSRAALGLAKT
jgi:CubicO group peptidase (beta-lactamase class C family)